MATSVLQTSHLDVAPEFRRCYDCGAVKPITDFAFHDKARGTRQGRCRQCHAAYRRAHYLRNRARYIRQEVARIRRYAEKNRPKIHEYLRTHPCVDCGETNIVVLDFDHRDPATKAHRVTVLARHKPWIRVLAEIAKCDAGARTVIAGERHASSDGTGSPFRRAGRRLKPRHDAFS